MPRYRNAGLAAVALALAACGGLNTGTLPSNYQVPAGSQQGDGSTGTLAGKLQDVHICMGYEDVPQNLKILKSGVRDIATCNLGHLAVFTGQAPRDRWVRTQLADNMAACATGQWWAVCMFPKTKGVSQARLQQILAGVTTT